MAKSPSRRGPVWIVVGFLLWPGPLAAAPPTVSNVRASQRAGTHLVDIYYDLADPDSPVLTVYVALSGDGGANYNLSAYTLAGAHGAGVAVGPDRHLVWTAGVDWGGHFSDRCRVRVTADDGSGPPAPSGMALIPFGPFEMGDPFYEADANELPVHTVQVSAFFMDKHEVTRELWLDVHAWALGHGYGFQSTFSAKAERHPILNVSWDTAVKWCNARSERDGLTPVYYEDTSHTIVYRSNSRGLEHGNVKWTANGYRLPTEAEWEKAARGGLIRQRYPWGNAITTSQANHFGSGDPWEQQGDIQTTPVGYYDGSQPYTPAGADMANGYGLYDMAGNVAEWCWDYYDETWYGKLGATTSDSRGPGFDNNRRVIRGGSWASPVGELRCAWRGGNPPFYWNETTGFRCVRGF